MTDAVAPRAVTTSGLRPARTSRRDCGVRGWPQVALWVAVTLLLAPGFAWNTWGVVPAPRFERFQQDTESHVVGRWVHSRQRGLFAAGGLTGVGVQAPPPSGRRQWPDAATTRAQYRAYLDGGTFAHYSAYRSQSGGQALLLGLVERALPLAPARKLDLLHALTALLGAATLACVVVWLRREAGWSAAALAGLSMLVSEWLTQFGRNLWWSLWAFYLPMVALMLWLRRREAPAGSRLRCGAVVFAAVLVKCWLNGFEYVTPTLVMMAVPFVYVAIVEAPGWREVRDGATGMVAASTSAVALAVALLVVQIGAAEGDWRTGLEHVRQVLVQRTVGSDESPQPDAARRALPSRLELLRQHLRVAFVELGRDADRPLGESDPGAVRVSQGELVALFAVASLSLWLLARRQRAAGARRRHYALLAATWFALLAPLSWIVVFQAHTARHFHINPITWQMPFTIFGFALVGATMAELARSLGDGWRRAGSG